MHPHERGDSAGELPDGQIRPALAPVTPRARSGPDGAALPLHQRIESLLQTGCCEPVNLYGPAGSGKTTALEHAAAMLPGAPVRFVDSELLSEPADNSATRELLSSIIHAPELTVFSSGRRLIANDHQLEIASWSQDEAIEYLLAVCPDRCGSVMGRLLECDRGALGGLPELWRIVLDAFASSPDIADVPGAIRRHAAGTLGDSAARDAAMHFCLQSMLAAASCDVEAVPRVRASQMRPYTPSLGQNSELLQQFPAVRKLIRHRPVQVALAAQSLLWSLRRGEGRDAMCRRLPRDVVRETAQLAAAAGLHEGLEASEAPAALQSLQQMLRQDDAPVQPLAASLLRAAGQDFPLRPGKFPRLAGAHLGNVQWAEQSIREIDLSYADLTHADLHRASLDGAILQHARLGHASLVGASLASAKCPSVDLIGADLSLVHGQAVDFRKARLRKANLCDADLTSANLSGADLTEALLIDACLRGASLVGAKFGCADLHGADLTGAAMPLAQLIDTNLNGACLRKANLSRCNLENAEVYDVNFSNAMLRGAMLTGSRMRKVDFAGADLRSAGMAHVDWEGVDLRGANLRNASFHLGSSRSGLVGSNIPCEGSRTGFYTDDFNDQDFKPPEEIRKANLCGVDLRGAKIRRVDFYLVDLRRAKYTKSQERHLRRCGAILDGNAE